MNTKGVETEVAAAVTTVPSSGIWRHVVLQKYIYVSEESIAFILRVEERTKQVSSKKQLEKRISNGLHDITS
jgi:hypothetical protein